jgi:NAD(P)H-dependent FMN reductase
MHPAGGAVTPPLIQIIVGTTRQGRFGERVAGWLLDRLAARDDLAVELVDLRDHPLPFYDLPRSPAAAPRDYPDEQVAAWGRTVDRADGYLVTAAEYNHGYSGVLKNALDHVFAELRRKPIAFAGYGSVGAARAVEQLRLVAVEMEMAPLRHAVHVLPDVMRAARSAAEPDPELFASLDQRLDVAVTDLVWWATALRAAREPVSDRP